MLDPEAHVRKRRHLLAALVAFEQGRGCEGDLDCLRRATHAVLLKRGRKTAEVGVCKRHLTAALAGDVASGWAVVSSRQLGRGELLDGPGSS